MIDEKMVTSSFGWAALGVSQAHAPTWGHLTLGLTCPCAMSGPSATCPHTGTPGAWAALPRAHSGTRAPRGDT